MRFADFRQPDSGREAVHVQNVGPLRQPESDENALGAADRDAVVGLVTRGVAAIG